MEINNIGIFNNGNDNIRKSRTFWSDEDIEYLYNNYYFKSFDEMSSYLGRPASAIKRKKEKLPIHNFKRPNTKYTPWSDEDIQFILDNEHMSINELASHLKRTVGAVKKKKYSLPNHKKNIKKIAASQRRSIKYEWSDKEILFLKENYKALSNQELSLKLDRSINAIKTRKKLLGLTTKKKVSWTTEEVEYLKANFKVVSEKKMAQTLGKSIESVYKKKKELGLKCDLSKWTEEDDAYLDMHWGFLTVNQLSQNLNRPQSTVIKRASTLGLGPLYRSGLFFTTCDVAKLIGTYSSVVLSWIKKGYLKVSMRQLKQRKIYLIKPENLLEFLKNYPSLWDSKYLEIGILGREEPWLVEKRRRDSKIPFKKKRKNWTSEEDNKLLYLINLGYTTDKIAKELGRTNQAILNRKKILISKGKKKIS